MNNIHPIDRQQLEARFGSEFLDFLSQVNVQADFQVAWSLQPSKAASWAFLLCLGQAFVAGQKTRGG